MSEYQTNTVEWAPALKIIALEMGERAVAMATTGNVVVEQKPDGTPVTSIDKELNRLLINLSQQVFPDVAIWSEEGSTAQYGDFSSVAGRSLVLGDPIDGTKKLVQSLDTGDMSGCQSTILLAAFAPDQTVPKAAVVYAPFLPGQPLYWADQDGAYVDRGSESKELRIQDEGPTDLGQVKTYKMSKWDGCAPSPEDVKAMLPNADDIQGKLRMISVAEGVMDLTIFPGPESNLHDVIPPAFIAYKAGAAVRALDGRPFEELMGRSIPGVIVAANQSLADLSIGYLNATTD